MSPCVIQTKNQTKEPNHESKVQTRLHHALQLRQRRTANPETVASGSAENRSFWRWTPSGSIELSTINPNVLAEMELGREYYVDFTVAAC